MKIIFCLLCSMLSVFGEAEQAYQPPKTPKLGNLKDLQVHLADVEIVGVGDNVPDVADAAGPVDDRIAKLEKAVDVMKKNLWTFETENCPSVYIWNKELKFCYNVHGEDEVNWHVAQLICRAETPGGRLVILDSDEKRLEVRKAILAHRSEPRNYFVGSRRAASDGLFRWTDGKLNDEITWCEGEPNGTNCGSLWGKMDYCMDDVHCKSQQAFVCEKPMK